MGDVRYGILHKFSGFRLVFRMGVQNRRKGIDFVKQPVQLSLFLTVDPRVRISLQICPNLRHSLLKNPILLPEMQKRCHQNRKPQAKTAGSGPQRRSFSRACRLLGSRHSCCQTGKNR